MTKRHAKPTSAQLIARMYRKVLEFKLSLLNQMALMRLDIARERALDREQLKTITDHCARLLKEKETLQRQVERMQALAPKQSIAAQDQSPFEPFEYNSLSSFAKMEMSHKVIDYYAAANSHPKLRNAPVPRGCSAGGNGIQPLPDYMHSKDCHFQAPFEIPTVYGAHEKLAADVLNFGFNGTTCTLAHLHRPGIRCEVCGETPDGFSEPARKL
jgi:hypothetical protein